jgi:uncharacterized protein YkvS
MTEIKVANTGDKILFQRKGQKITGKVVKVKEESVLVSVTQQDAKLLHIETPITVVAHKNYQLV